MFQLHAWLPGSFPIVYWGKARFHIATVTKYYPAVASYAQLRQILNQHGSCIYYGHMDLPIFALTQRSNLRKQVHTLEQKIVSNYSVHLGTLHLLDVLIHKQSRRANRVKLAVKRNDTYDVVLHSKTHLTDERENCIACVEYFLNLKSASYNSISIIFYIFSVILQNSDRIPKYRQI